MIYSGGPRLMSLPGGSYMYKIFLLIFAQQKYFLVYFYLKKCVLELFCGPAPKKSRVNHICVNSIVNLHIYPLPITMAFGRPCSKQVKLFEDEGNAWNWNVCNNSAKNLSLVFFKLESLHLKVSKRRCYYNERNIFTRKKCD